MAPRVTIIVLDGCGVGGAPDADDFGDHGSNTLGNLARLRAEEGEPLEIPNLVSLGLSRIVELPGASCEGGAAGAFGRMREQGRAKDTTAGHWEMMGLAVDCPFPTYPNGFPPDLVASVSEAAGCEFIGNEVASGTEIVARLGREAVDRKAVILYTSADSVFQLAAHEDVVPVEELYRICKVARDMLVGDNAVGRVIARPFVGSAGSFVRTSRRRDFSVPPLGRTVIDALANAAVPVLGVGKVGEVFTCRGFADSVHTATNEETVELVVEHLGNEGRGLIFANLGDFDTLWGHRNDSTGFAGGLEAFDRRVPEITDALRPDDILVVTADHGCDPTTPSTDHSREDVPLLVFGPRVRPDTDLGTRETFSDLGASVADYLGVGWDGPGRSFVREVLV